MWLFKRNNDQTDEELLESFRHRGDKAIFAGLFKNHVSAIYGTCLFYLKDKDEAKDEVMNIFEKLMEDLKHNEIRNFKAWLSFVVRNHCISVLRKKNTLLKHTKAYYDFELKETTYETELKIERVSDDKLLYHLNECLPQLKEKQRKCIELFYIQNMSYQQISEITGMETGEVKSNIQNGKRNLKLMIEALQNPPANEKRKR